MYYALYAGTNVDKKRRWRTEHPRPSYFFYHTSQHLPFIFVPFVRMSLLLTVGMPGTPTNEHPAYASSIFIHRGWDARYTRSIHSIHITMMNKSKIFRRSQSVHLVGRPLLLSLSPFPRPVSKGLKYSTIFSCFIFNTFYAVAVFVNAINYTVLHIHITHERIQAGRVGRGWVWSYERHGGLLEIRVPNYKILLQNESNLRSVIGTVKIVPYSNLLVKVK